jgi:uncharacterized membrane protein (DUF485 family)
LKTEEIEEVINNFPRNCCSKKTDLIKALANEWSAKQKADPFKYHNLRSHRTALTVWLALTTVCMLPYLAMMERLQWMVDPTATVPKVFWWLLGAFSILIVTWCVVNRKANQALQHTVRFENDLHELLVSFRNQFLYAPGHKVPDRGILFDVVDKGMISVAECILINERVHGRTDQDREVMSQKSNIANQFGLGWEWKYYFDRARNRLGYDFQI